MSSLNTSLDISNIDELLDELEKLEKENTDLYPLTNTVIAKDSAMKETASEQLRKNDIQDLKDRGKNNSELFNEFVTYYKDKNKQNLLLKLIFFWFFMGFLTVILVILPLVLVVATILGSLQDKEVIVAFSSSVLSMITAIIVIPKIIAKYLFSIKEDKVISELVKKIQDHDEETRRIHNQNK